MAKTLTIEIPDEIYGPLAREAQQRGETPEQVVLHRISRGQSNNQAAEDLTQKEYEAAMADIMKHSGAVSVPDPTNADNEAIDRDLAAEYEATHEGEQ